MRDNEDVLTKAHKETARLKSEIGNLAGQFASANKNLANEQTKRQQAEKQLRDNEDALKKAYKETARLKSEEERTVILKIDSLNKLTQYYLKHLINYDDKSPLMEAKMASTYELLEHLNNTKLLPSEQLSAFNNTLQSTQETLKEHRDPTWMRIFRDCVRIITVALSGVGLYRVATGQSPQFFKPSHGENFVEEATKTSAPTAK